MMELWFIRKKKIFSSASAYIFHQHSRWLYIPQHLEFFFHQSFLLYASFLSSQNMFVMVVHVLL